jgi:hypothetical protein
MKNIVFCFWVSLLIGCGGYNYRPELTHEGIRNIEMGMNLEQVLKHIGVPYEVNANSNTHNIGCKSGQQKQAKVRTKEQLNETIKKWELDTSYCCEANKENRKTRGGYTMCFTNEIIFNITNYPMVWVHLDSSLLVNQVYVKLCEDIIAFECIEIYSLSEYGLKEDPKFLTAFRER